MKELIPSGGADLATLTDQARGYAAQSKAPATIRAYESDWRLFTAWCASHGLPAMPATPATVALYIAGMAAGGAAVATITRRLASIAKAHAAGGADSPCSMRHAAVSEVLQGIRRTVGTAQRQAAPLLTQDIAVMLAHVPEGLLGVRDRALLLSGFAGAFRRAELVGLQVADLVFSGEGVRCTVRRSKTDQDGTGQVVAIARGGRMCPVAALEAWISAAGITGGPVFRSISRHGAIGQGLTDQMVSRIVKGYATAAGIDPAQYSGHSLRAGLATQAAIAGAADRDIQRQTRHKSAAMVQRYIRDGQAFRDNVSGRLGL